METSTTSENAEHVELGVVNIANRVLRGRKILLATTLAGLTIGAGCAMLLKPWYYAQAVFIPPKYSDLVTTTPVASLLSGSSDSSDAYLGLLNSRTVQDDVVEHTDLMQAYRAPTKTAARLMLAKKSLFGVGRNSLIYITIESDTPKRAADIANAYLEALYRLNEKMVQSSSARRRSFFQDQLNEQKQILLDAEEQLKSTQEHTGVVLPVSQAQAGVNATSQLQSQINGAEARLAGLLMGETDQAPEVVQTRAQIRRMRDQLSEENPVTNGSSAQKLPGLALEVEQKEREARLNEATYESLLQQYGRARLASIDPGPQLEVVDVAIPAEYKGGPNRRNVLMYGGGIGFVLGLLYVLFLEPLRALMLRLATSTREGI